MAQWTSWNRRVEKLRHHTRHYDGIPLGAPWAHTHWYRDCNPIVAVLYTQAQEAWKRHHSEHPSVAEPVNALLAICEEMDRELFHTTAPPKRH